MLILEFFILFNFLCWKVLRGVTPKLHWLLHWIILLMHGFTLASFEEFLIYLYYFLKTQ